MRWKITNSPVNPLKRFIGRTITAVFSSLPTLDSLFHPPSSSMKFFSEFRSCCGAASLPELTTQVQLDETGPGPVRPRVRGSKLPRWKPALAAISEDSVTLMHEETRKRMMRSDEKPQGESGSLAKTRNTSQKADSHG